MRPQNCGKLLLAFSYLSFRLHGITLHTLDGFSLNLVCEYFSEISIKFKFH
jgi:hypothetical protein